MSVLRKRLPGDGQGLSDTLRDLKGSETAKAAGLAGAMIANNVIALISTVVFARLLTDYGSLAALISYFLILSVAGQALHVATLGLALERIAVGDRAELRLDAAPLMPGRGPQVVDDRLVPTGA